jgi:hypothetical protein
VQRLHSWPLREAERSKRCSTREETDLPDEHVSEPVLEMN